MYTHKYTIVSALVIVVLFAGWLLMRAPQAVEAPEAIPEDTATAGENASTTPATENEPNIIVDTPRGGENVTSPLTVSGKAKGYWYFEGSFPVTIVDWDGKIIGEGYATAQGDWMTYEYVPFTAEVTFTAAEISGNYSRNGALILQKANPSDLPENSEALEMPVVFGE